MRLEAAVVVESGVLFPDRRHPGHNAVTSERNRVLAALEIEVRSLDTA
jgi:hypothetical protein